MNQPSLLDAAAALRSVVTAASAGLVERATLVDAVVLAAVAGEHVLVIGPPGTAKSEAVRRVAQATGGRYFEYLLGRFTEPSELFGPIDLRKLREGVVATETAGMLPEADIAFLDELFLGSTAILNTLLGVLNERVFRRGHTNMPVPLRLCVGAANALPDEPALAAFADRFLVRVFIDPLPDAQLDSLLEGGWSLPDQPPVESGSLQMLDMLARTVRHVSLETVRAPLADAIRLLRRAGITLSDRRAVKTQRLIAAAAVLDGRAHASDADLWPLILAVPTREEQAIARETVRDLLAAADNRTVAAAAEAASLGPHARAARLVADAGILLGARPTALPDLQTWQLKLEGLVREVDAGFAPEALPRELADVRQVIVAALELSPIVAGKLQDE